MNKYVITIEFLAKEDLPDRFLYNLVNRLHQQTLDENYIEYVSVGYSNESEVLTSEELSNWKKNSGYSE